MKIENNTKRWNVAYSVKYKSGEISEKETTVRANDIMRALRIAIVTVKIPTERQEPVESCVIWSVGIIDDEVF